MKKLLLASLLLTSVTAFAQSEQSVPLITDSNRAMAFPFPQSEIKDTQLTPINCSIPSDFAKKDTAAFNVSVELYKEGKNNKKEVIYDTKTLASDSDKIGFSNTQSISYISSISTEPRNDLASQEVAMEFKELPPKLVITPAELITGFTAYVSPKTVKDKTNVELCFTKSDLVELKDFSTNIGTVQLPTSNFYSILQTHAVELNKPTVVQLKDGLKMSVLVSKI